MNTRPNTLVDGLAATGDHVEKPALGELPAHIGRYRVERVIGKGGFGLVYLAHDDQLRRPVAIKVPHAGLVAQVTDAEAYLAEARTVAGLDHPHIVPVYDVGSTDAFPCFVVSKFIDGTDLAARLKQSRISVHEAVGLVATVAEALHHAHKQGLVHRDVKPGNILLDRDGKPFVGDFGLALREQDVGKGPRFAGTPAYMSPEQARGEGHRVDGRSDIFSLGVVFYEMLVDRMPFRADSQHELLEQISLHDPRPPRQHDDELPKELERVCLKALSKRAADRYTTAKDMADDLRHFQAVLPGETATTQVKSNDGPPPILRAAASKPIPQDPPAMLSDSKPLRIVPKGLRSFDAHDADFFLELLPGPRDRDGLPDSIRFWKLQLDEADADGTFAVGLIYGPSGCGKSSLVKAGLLPRLAPHVIAVYVEATGEETEARLLNGLRKRCPALPTDIGLKETIALLRRGQGVLAGKKVVLILDQFEQWLHAKKEEQKTELVQALRQCDGGRVQAVVMVRDDFWLAVSRFLRELEIRLLEGQNSALVDLFDLDHARKVLAAFGRAFSRLPENIGTIGREQSEFLRQAIAGLAQEGKVISVRLALFAEMMKGRPWTPASLKEVGGAQGVGAAFLEETFSASTAPPEHRYHQQAARGVLQALLPGSGTDIKGHMRSRAELLEASGYAKRLKDFDDLLRLLDSEIRLITPTDPEGTESLRPVATTAGEPEHGEPMQPLSKEDRYYQLTHDYLVHSLRDWLTRKQKETRRGRAELMLADRAAVWNARPESRQLPSLRQSLGIRCMTARQKWTPGQRKMMSACFRHQAIRGTILAVLLAVGLFAGLTIREGVVEQRRATQAAGLVQRLLDAQTEQVPAIVAELANYRQWADPLLREEHAKAPDGSRQKLHSSLALLPVDPGQADYLAARLLDAQPSDVLVIRNALEPYRDALRERLWKVVEDRPTERRPQRLRAAAALATFDSTSKRWEQCSTLVVHGLMQENPLHLGQWKETLRPIKDYLLSQLVASYKDKRPEFAAERTLVTSLLADYADDQPKVLCELLMDADEKQFDVFFPKIRELGTDSLSALIREIDKKAPEGLQSSDERLESLAKRQANAGVALLRLNHPDKTWELLKFSPDPRARSFLVHRLSSLGADAQAIVNRFDDETVNSIRLALLLSLGEFGERELPSRTRNALLPKLRAAYCTDADPGIHAAAEWLLRTWKQDEWLKKIREDWASGAKASGSWQPTNAVVSDKVRKSESRDLGWHVNSQGQSYVMIAGPVEFIMGSPLSEKGHGKSEVQHLRRIGRSFAISAKLVTLEEYRGLTKEAHIFGDRWEYMPDRPVMGISWHMAARYCNLLSEAEGIPDDQWCYELDGGKAKPKPNYLKLTGYRLPTEAEIEYATRAKSVTSRYFGETEELLGNYAWYLGNSNNELKPVGYKKPNDFGLFDAHGNCHTWCHEADFRYPSPINGNPVEDVEGPLTVPELHSRELRGGSFESQAAFVRSAFRTSNVPTNRNINLGLRPSRTVNP